MVWAYSEDQARTMIADQMRRDGNLEDDEPDVMIEIQELLSPTVPRILLNIEGIAGYGFHTS
jgi:hypothetical protein